MKKEQIITLVDEDGTMENLGEKFGDQAGNQKLS